jgi:hypothetical protein
MKPNITNDAPSLIDDPRNIAETRQYLQDFNRMDDTTTTARELYDAMLGLYSDCTNRRRVNAGRVRAMSASDAVDGSSTGT